MILNRRLLFYEQVCLVVNVRGRFRASYGLHGRAGLLPLYDITHDILLLVKVLLAKRAHKLDIVCMITMASNHSRLCVKHFGVQVLFVSHTFSTLDAIFWRVVDYALFVNHGLALRILHIDCRGCCNALIFIGWSRNFVHLHSKKFPIFRIFLAQYVIEKLVNVRMSDLRLL